jgi:hypothetical protein
MSEQEVKTRKQAPITSWELKYIELVNKELTKKGWDINKLARELKSYNYDRFRDFFGKKSGRLESRTIGRINKVLDIK